MTADPSHSAADDNSSAAEEEEEGYAQLNANQNRKQKRAGGWQAMGLDHAVHKGIMRKGYRQPTPIQRKAIPLVCAGKDVVAMSRTGSGKTAAFVVPMLQKLKKRDTRGIRAVLLSPTRELALQTFKIVKELGRYTGLFCACLIGGDSMDEQFSILHQHPDILLATPGRLLHLVIEMNLKLASVQYIVFDEADRLFEMGFADQITEIVKRLPESRQTLLFSATLPKMLIDFAKAGLSDPSLVRLDVESKLSDKLSMVFAFCRHTEKLPVLINLCRALDRTHKKTIIFCATMKHVEFVVAILREAGLEPAFLYSQLDPVARKQNISRFRQGECNLLVVTDIAARGVDIPLLDFAVNMHFPPKPKLFVHRVGRVARAGMTGTSISFVAPDEMAYLLDLFLFIGQPVKFVQPYSGRSNDDESSLIGTFPDTLAHTEMEFLLNIQKDSVEISDLLHKSENAMKKYQRTRPQPSAESVRRVKSEFRNVCPGPHPFFLDSELFPDIAPAKGTEGGIVAEQAILQKIREWRPNQTVFELQNTIGRRGGNIAAKRERLEKLTGGSGNSSRKQLAEERKAEEKAQHFVPYVSSDANTESGLAVEKETGTGRGDCFETMARSVGVELTADDDQGLHMETKRKTWDRKRKKFVGAQEQRAKRVKTEEGNWVPVSYRSGRYDKWRQKQRMDFQREEDDDGADNNRRRNRAKADGAHNLMKNSFMGKRRNPAAKGRGAPEKNELRSMDQIVKGRKKKARLQAYQSHRRDENLKKKAKAGPRAKGRGARSGREGGGGRGGERKSAGTGRNRNYQRRGK